MDRAATIVAMQVKAIIILAVSVLVIFPSLARNKRLATVQRARTYLVTDGFFERIDSFVNRRTPRKQQAENNDRQETTQAKL